MSAIGVPQRISQSAIVGWVRPLTISTGRMALVIALGLAIFSVILIIDGHDALNALDVMYTSSIGSEFGRQEILVKLIPFGLCAAATAIPARAGLINVGGEGQFYMGAFAASGVVLFSGAPGWALLPLAFVAGMVGGGAWAGVTALLRIKGNVNEAISSLLLNYVAVQIVNYFVYGPWRDPEGPAWPYTKVFPDAAALPTVYGRADDCHLHVLRGARAHVRGASATPVSASGRASSVAMPSPPSAPGSPSANTCSGPWCMGGAMAGLAGMAEVTGIQGRLRSGISVQYGYIGFLASWLGGHGPVGIFLAALLFATISVGGDGLQIGASLPASTVNILMALILFGVLASRKKTFKVGG